MYVPKYRLWEKWLNKCLKSPFSEHPSTVNMLKGPKHVLNLPESTLSDFFMTMSNTDFKKISLSDMWLPKALR